MTDEIFFESKEQLEEEIARRAVYEEVMEYMKANGLPDGTVDSNPLRKLSF